MTEQLRWTLPTEVVVRLVVTLPSDGPEPWPGQPMWPDKAELLEMVRAECEETPDGEELQEHIMRLVKGGEDLKVEFVPPHPEWSGGGAAAASADLRMDESDANTPNHSAQGDDDAVCPTVTITCASDFRLPLMPLRAGLALARGLMELSARGEVRAGDWTSARTAEELVLHDSPSSANQPPDFFTFSELVCIVATPHARIDGEPQRWTLRTEGMRQLGLPELEIRDLADADAEELEGASAMLRAGAGHVLRSALEQREAEVRLTESVPESDLLEPLGDILPAAELTLPTLMTLTANDALWLEGYRFADEQDSDDDDDAEVEGDEAEIFDVSLTSDDDADDFLNSAEFAEAREIDDDATDDDVSKGDKFSRAAFFQQFEDQLHSQEIFAVILRRDGDVLLLEPPPEDDADATASGADPFRTTAGEFLQAYQAAARACQRERTGRLNLEDPVYNIEGEHPALQRARQLARETLPDALQRFKNGLPDNIALYVKQAFPTDDDDLEFMWVLVSQIEDDAAEGTLANDPHNVPWLNVGDPVTVPLGNIDDWMLRSDDGTIEGGFSINVIREYGED